MKLKKQILLGLSALVVTAACSTTPPAEEPQQIATIEEPPAAPPVAAPVLKLNDVATAYVKLVLALGQVDADYVDAFYGPAEWKTEAAQNPKKLQQIEEEAQELIAALGSADTSADDGDPEALALRKSYLKNQLGSLTARARLLQGERMSFDDEARALYDVDPPHYAETDFQPVLKIMDGLLPKGPGSLAERYNRYIEQYAVPAARLETVMRTAIGVAQYRSAAHLQLPPGERFDLAFVSGKPWSAYNWYQGNYVSRIEVNTDLPIPISRVIELAAHEGYPGHHVYNGLLEQALLRQRGWPEYQIYALFSPQSFIAEGSADFGIGMVFPGNEKLEFTRELFQLSGFDTKQAANYLEVVDAAKALAPAAIEGARRYLDGEFSTDSLLAWLQKYTLASPARAKQRLAFIERYRSYIINYSYGEEIVRDFVEKEGDKTPGSAKQWQAFTALLSTPRTPTALQTGPKPLPLVLPASTSIVISTPEAADAAPPSDRAEAAVAAPKLPPPVTAPQPPTPAAAAPKAAAKAKAPPKAKAIPKAKVPPAKRAPPPAAKKAEPKPGLANSAEFKHFIAGKPTPAQFHKRYPNVSLILFGSVSSKEYRTDNSRYFAQLDGRGRVIGGKFK
ncbi:MAG: hypothetical protein JWR16_751 [Nevskia sp.]|nr:hypothetical protein [Nevskia sp.]